MTAFLKLKLAVPSFHAVFSWFSVDLPSSLVRHGARSWEFTNAQNMLVGGGTSGASGSGTAGEAPLAAGPPV
ncbi:hypothetical protein P8452_08380 [Trifolium repens]|nr:hypothetical protein P8452_08380 [Trifolium repens]